MELNLAILSAAGAKSVFRRFPEARQVDKTTPFNDRRKMGYLSWTAGSADENQVIVILYVVHKVLHPPTSSSCLDRAVSQIVRIMRLHAIYGKVKCEMSWASGGGKSHGPCLFPGDFLTALLATLLGQNLWKICENLPWKNPWILVFTRLSTGFFTPSHSYQPVKTCTFTGLETCENSSERTCE